MFRFPAVMVFAAAVGIAATSAVSRSFAADVVVETVLNELIDPCCLAIRPTAADGAAYEVLVYDRGAGRIVSVRSDLPNKSTELMSGLKSAGGAGLLFVLDNSHVVIGGVSDEGLLSVYQLPAQGGTLTTDKPKQRIDVGQETTASPAGRSHAIARTRANDRVPDLLVVATLGKHGTNQLWKVPIRADTLGEAAPFLADSTSGIKPISALAVSEQGFLLAAENSEGDDAAVSQLTFFNPIDGSQVLQLPVDLREILGIAFSPVSGNLYVAGVEPGSDKAGVYRIDEAGGGGKPACAAVKIADIERPASLVFGPDSALYVATGDADSPKAQGGLVRIVGNL